MQPPGTRCYEAARIIRARAYLDVKFGGCSAAARVTLRAGGNSKCVNKGVLQTANKAKHYTFTSPPHNSQGNTTPVLRNGDM